MYDLDLIEELEFFENDELDSIEEASTQNNIREYAKGLIRTIFQHMIKYQYNQRKQSKSWVSTIIRDYKKLSEIDKHKLFKLVQIYILDEAYFEGRKLAIDEDDCNVIKKESSEWRPYEWDLYFLTNIESIKEFLYTYQSNSMVYKFDLDECIERGLKSKC